MESVFGSQNTVPRCRTLADMDHDGSLSLVEFAVAMHCVCAVQAGVALPGIVPRPLRDALLFHVNRNDVLSQNKVRWRAGLPPRI